MTKDTLISAMAERAGITRAAAASALAAAVEQIGAGLAAGNRVRVPGLGSFEPVAWTGRTARHPRNGTLMRISDRVRIRFEASTELRARVNYSCGS